MKPMRPRQSCTGRVARWLRFGLLFGLAAALAACSALQPRLDTAASAKAASAPAAVAEGAADSARRIAVAAFVQQQRGAAEAAERQGRWADAAWALESLVALTPSDAALSGRLQRAREASETLSTLRQQQALLALQLDEPGKARQLLIRALEAQPDNALALERLRALERQLQQARMPAAPSHPEAVAGPYRPAHEAALLLTQQGHLAQAIQALGPARDNATRVLLASLHRQQAQAWWPQEADRALASLRRSAQLDRQNPETAKLLREWERQSRAARRPGPLTPPQAPGTARQGGAPTR